MHIYNLGKSFILIKMKNIPLILVVILSLFASSHSISQSDDDWQEAVQRHQDSLEEVYTNPQTSILKGKALRTFKGLAFYEIDSNFRVSATFTKSENEKPFPMATSTGIPRMYITYGEISFELFDKTYQLTIYQNPAFTEVANHPYKDHLMLGFTDYTSGDGSYGGGRYVDVLISQIKNNRVDIDFNKAYNPYCAYTEGYSCAIPPEDNDLKVRVAAGVKDYEKNY